MDSQAKQKATHDVHVRMIREFYSGDRVLVKDLRKEDTWWPGSVVERSGPRSYAVVLNDGRGWKGVEASCRSREKGQYGQSSVRP